MTQDDASLLRRFVAENSEPAFAELVRRYLDLVYGAALRQVNGDSGLATDVCQTVFIDLARKARSLRQEVALAAWLHRATRLAALAALRSNSRRAIREQEAAVMYELHQTEPSPEWDTLRPVIDSALDHLNDPDRAAILLRYFRRRSLRDVAAALGLSENAARMRVDRALDKLRRRLSKRGVTSTTSALAVVLTGQAITLAPTSLAASISAAALSVGVAASASTAGFFPPLMASIKMKLGLAGVLTVAVTAPIVMQHRENARLREENQSLISRAAEGERLRLENAELQAARTDPLELARLRSQQDELLRLRAEVAKLRKPVPKPGGTAPLAPALTAKPNAESGNKDFISADAWTDVGTDTPEHAFQSFLAALKTGDADHIASTVHWDVKWKDPVTEDDKKLIEKSTQDYLEMLQRAPTKLSAFRLGSLTDSGVDRKRVYFSTLTADGTTVESSFEMIHADGQWKPILSMHWLDLGSSGTTFATSPVFGPQIDLEH